MIYYEGEEVKEKILKYHIFLKYGYYFDNGCGGSYSIHTETIEDIIYCLEKYVYKIDFKNDPVYWYDWMKSDYEKDKYISKEEYINFIKNRLEDIQ